MIRILFAIAALSPNPASASPAGSFDSGSLGSTTSISDDDNGGSNAAGANPAPLPLAGIPALIALAGGAGVVKLRRRRA